MSGPLKFGIFTPPHHRVGQSPSILIEHFLQLWAHADQLGFDEAWVGEHHSGGWELVCAPDVFIAAAAQRTGTMKLGTGVTALSYQHPFILAEKMVMLDQLTRGRMVFGVGPGGNPIDAGMMGLDPNDQRRMMDESMEAMIALLALDGPITRKTDWFVMENAELQLAPYTLPRFEIGVSSLGSPAGPRLAGRYGLSLLSIGATTPKGFDFLAQSWEIACEQADRYGQVMDPGTWRLMCPMHVAETEEEARRQVRHEFNQWLMQYGTLLGLATMLKPLYDEPDIDRKIDLLNQSGFGVIGTPEMAIAQIHRMQQAAPGFGTVLLTNFGWSVPDGNYDFDSLEVVARRVMPVFRDHLDAPMRAFGKLQERAVEVQNVLTASRQKAADDLAEEQAALR
jgi:limonene 1,2-monooxygenase